MFLSVVVTPPRPEPTRTPVRNAFCGTMTNLESSTCHERGGEGILNEWIGPVRFFRGHVRERVESLEFSGDAAGEGGGVEL